MRDDILIIAEIGQNHNGDMKLAKRLIRAAKEAGADIAKFQIYEVDKIFPKRFKWYKEGLRAQLNKDHVAMLKRECDKVGIEFLASVFDTERVKWCEAVGMKRYKIASRSIYDKELKEDIEKTGKDIIVSLGMYKGKNFPIFHTKGKVDFLYCIAKYPAPIKYLNFEEIDFKMYSGFSDHTIGIEASIIAMARGAKIIEKHFTLDKDMPGPDHILSAEPSELRLLVDYARKFKRILRF